MRKLRFPRGEVTCTRSFRAPCGRPVTVSFFPHLLFPSSSHLTHFPQGCKSRAGIPGEMWGILEAWKQFWAVKSVGGVHADSLCVCEGRALLAPRGLQNKPGTEISPMSPFHSLVLKGGSQMVPQCPDSSTHVSRVDRVLCQGRHSLIIYWNCCVNLGKSLNFSGSRKFRSLESYP